MSAETTYLELSEDNGTSHKFYEVVVDGKTVTIRYGRIGDNGQSKVSSFATPEAAKAEAQKKLNEKRRKGYAEAVRGMRQKRAVTRRVITSQASTAKQAPVLWKFMTGARALGIFIDEARCWVGNEDGSIFSLDHDGKVIDQFRLPDGVKCIVADDDWLYAGCDDGNVYDLGGKFPRKAYAINENVDIFWIDIKDGVLGVSDASGEVVTINHEDESRWKKKSSGSSGWMVRCDELGIYHGHSSGVTMYDWEDGRQIWHRPTRGAVLFGWQEESEVFASTSSGKIHRFTKRGEGERVYDCDAAVFSCAASPDGKYVFGGDNCSSVYCFDENGKRLWKLGTGCGSAYSMQFFRDRLYIVTTDGALACIDASEAAITGATAGQLPKTVDIKAPAPIAAAAVGQVDGTTTTADGGVVVECYREGGSLRVRPVSAGFERSFHVQFPKDIREEGARYVVDELRKASKGDFYRALGKIRRLVS